MEKTKFKLLLVSFIICTTLFTGVPIQEAFAMPTVEWRLNGGSTASMGFSASNLFNGQPATIFVSDPSLSSNGLDTIQVIITTTKETITISIQENILDNGQFESNIIFMENNNRFSLANSISLNYEDDNYANNGILDTSTSVGDQGIFVFSDTEVGNGNNGIVFNLFTETNPDSGIFVSDTKLTFSNSASDEPNGVLLVSNGDFLTFRDLETNAITNGIILPLIDGKFAVVAEKSTTISATYNDGMNDFSDNLILLNNDPPGRGSGGAVNPGLVVDTNNGGGGCDGNCQPPTLGLDQNYNRMVKNGFSYNGNPVDVEYFYTPYPLIIVKTGEENKAILKIFDELGPDKIKHVGLGFGLGYGESFSNSRATINVEWNFLGEAIVSTYDPENVLDNVRISTEIDSCAENSTRQCLVVIIFHTFRDRLEFNMVSTNVWDQNRNSWQNFYNHGIEITGDSLNPPRQHIGIHQGNQITLTEVSKGKAVDGEGNTWTFNKIWEKDYIQKDKIKDPISMHGYDRNHAFFEIYKKGQILLAEQKLDSMLDGKRIQSEIDNSKTIVLYENKDLNKLQLEEQILKEALKALQKFYTTYNIKNNF